ncbi:SCO family protein [Paucisalibacillus globulus]|uniref:SCO family protein n=1 Tax=Paucisalibacillus globulus TaxID=351095 RepID=UPI0003FCB6A5|nr:SCO family protein [Paucisalibacillus globulus]
MRKNKHQTIAIVLIMVFGFIVFYIGTDGFQAYTAETARSLQLEKERPTFPEVTLEDSKERAYTFSEFEGKYVMLTFIYTACTDVCPQLEMNLNEVYQQIPKEYLGDDIVFLSISFDPDRDDISALQKYSHYFNADEETWRMTRVPDKQELQNLLDAFGVIVIPDGTGNFTHNSAFYLVDPDGKLEEIMDYTKTDEAALKVNATLDKKAGE